APACLQKIRSTPPSPLASGSPPASQSPPPPAPTTATTPPPTLPAMSYIRSCRYHGSLPSASGLNPDPCVSARIPQQSSAAPAVDDPSATPAAPEHPPAPPASTRSASAAAPRSATPPPTPHIP